MINSNEHSPVSGIDNPSSDDQAVTDPTRQFTPAEGQTPAPGDTRSTNGKHRPNGKIARLPKDLRDKVNVMLRDGVPYSRVLKHIEDSLPVPLEDPISEQNLSNWKNAGHQVWLHDQEQREEILEARDDALQFPGDDESRLEQATLKIASTRLFQLFKHLEPAAFAGLAQRKPETYARLFSALPRITREGLRYQKYRDACVQARAALQPLKDPKRKLNDDERRAIVRHVDEILGLASPARPPDTPPANGDAPTPM
jgi:hypothetical protein